MRNSWNSKALCGKAGTSVYILNQSRNRNLKSCRDTFQHKEVNVPTWIMPQTAHRTQTHMGDQEGLITPTSPLAGPSPDFSITRRSPLTGLTRRVATVYTMLR